MTIKEKRPSGESLGTALVSLSAALGLLIGVRAIWAADLPGIRPLLGMARLPREALGLTWSPRASWPADFQQVALERMLGLVGALILAAAAVSVMNTLVVLVEAGSARRRELAVRVAVGASPLTVTRELLGAVRRLVTTSAALGLVLGLLTGGALRAAWPAFHDDLAVGSALGELLPPVMLLVAVAASGYAAVGVRLSFGRGLAGSLGGGGRISDDRGAVAVRRLLAACQMGVAGTVLVAGFLLVSGLSSPTTETGDERTDWVVALTMTPELAEGGWAPILEILADIPGIQAESLATYGTLSGVGLRDYVTAHCGNCFRGGLPTPFWSVYADHYAIGPDFFDLAGFELAEGRALGLADEVTSEDVAVVNRTFANTAFEDGKPLGRKIKVGRGMDDWFTVVGVVEDRPVTVLGGRDQPGAAVYLSALQQPPRTAVALLQGDAHAASEASRALSALGVATGDPRLVTSYLRSLRAPQRWAALISVILAALILSLSIFGTRTLATQIIGRSAHDLAIRRAVGATDARILRHVLAGSARSGLWGGAISVFFGTLAVALLRKALGGLPTPGPLLYLAVVALLTTTAMAASWGAARAATRVPPASALE